MAQLTGADFARMALAEFGDDAALREDFADNEGLPHVRMGAFARLMQRAKGAADWATYDRAARLADELWRGADSELKNTLYVSLLEHLDFEGPRGPAAWTLLGPRLQAGWREITAYNAWLAAGAKGPPPIRQAAVQRAAAADERGWSHRADRPSLTYSRRPQLARMVCARS